MTAIATGSDVSVDAIVRLFQATDPDRVRAFLSQRPLLRALLVEASDVLPRYFPIGTTSSLDVAQHPESGSRPELVLRINPPLPMSEALKQLDRLDEDWWLDELPRANGELTITVWPA
jgi:hypothetical protein